MCTMNEAPGGTRPQLRTALSLLGALLLVVAVAVALVTATGARTTAPEATGQAPASGTVPDDRAVPAHAAPPASVTSRSVSPTNPVETSVPVAAAAATPSDPVTATLSTTPRMSTSGTAPTPDATASEGPEVAEVVAQPLPAPPHIPTPAAIGDLIGGNPNRGPAPGADGVFRMTGPAPVNGADYGPMAYVLPLNPPGPQNSTVRWVDGMGVSPTAAERGTVYVLGHAWARQWLVFNGFSELATRSVNLGAPPQRVAAYGGGTVRRWSTPVLNGSRITMADASGRQRVWSVDNTWLVPKSEAINDVELNSTGIPGRIILIACAVGDGRDLDYNVIVSGHLV